VLHKLKVEEGGMFKKAYERIKTELTSVLTDEQGQWLDSGLTKLAGSSDLSNDLLTLSAITRRKLGQKFFTPELEPFQLQSDLFLSFHNWNYADAGRALFILQTVAASAKHTQEIIKEYFQQGDEAEVAVITRLLILFDKAEELKPYAREVGRTNSMALYAALAQYNPYPAEYYTDHEFNQLVLKALFMGISIAPVSNLQKRANAELSQMCENYIKERVAADRSIPADIWLALEPYASQEGEALMISHLSSDVPEHRYFVVKAMQQAPGSDERQQLLDELLKVEKDPRILELLK